MCRRRHSTRGRGSPYQIAGARLLAPRPPGQIKLTNGTPKARRVTALYITRLIFFQDHTGKFLSESRKIKPNLDCNYFFLIDVVPNRIPIAAKSIVKVYNLV